MVKKEDWIRKTTINGNCIELIYVETDEKGAYVIKEIMDGEGNTIKRIKDVILDFPIEIIEIRTIKEFNSPYGEYDQRVYKININGKTYMSTVRQARLLIQKRVVKQPFYSKYGFKFKGYLNMVLRSQEKRLEKRGN